MTITLPSLKPALMGGASLAVIAIAVFAARDLPRQAELAPPPLPAPAELAPAPAPAEPKAKEDDDRALSAYLQTEREPAAPTVALDSLGVGGGGGELQMEAMAPALAPADAGAGASVTGGTASGLASMTAPERTAAAPRAKVAEPAPLRLRGGVPAAEELRSVAPQVMIAPADMPAQPGYRDQGRDNFREIALNPVKVTAEEPVSTFSIDVDTASYAFVRRELMAGLLPQKDAVRVEEMVNYFPYDYPLPESREAPFRADVQIIPTPWNPQTRLLRVGIQGYALAEAEKPRSNLVFLIDSSGSMDAPDKLPLLVNSFRLLLDSLDPDDTVAIVTYAGAAGTVLEPTRAAEAGKILDALERLQAGGSTAGAEGIRQAYALAERNFDPQGVNRVILATDGDFNVGITDMDELQGFVERKRETGVFLSVLGFGQGNLNDALMQALAQNGNGQAAYIDTLGEARKVMVEEAGSTLFPIARDVKIQIEFNPAAVAEYRLIGYETRLLNREDFNNDKVDAGEVGSGHAVTALYELTPAGSAARLVEGLRYQPTTPQEANPSEYAFVKIRYKAPEGGASRLVELPVTRAAEVDGADARSRETRFAAAVAGFGELLRGGRHTGSFGYDDVAALAQGARGEDPYGYRTEFVTLVRLAKSAAALEPLK